MQFLNCQNPAMSDRLPSFQGLSNTQINATRVDFNKIEKFLSNLSDFSDNERLVKFAEYRHSMTPQQKERFYEESINLSERRARQTINQAVLSGINETETKKFVEQKEAVIRQFRSSQINAQQAHEQISQLNIEMKGKVDKKYNAYASQTDSIHSLPSPAGSPDVILQRALQGEPFEKMPLQDQIKLVDHLKQFPANSPIRKNLPTTLQWTLDKSESLDRLKATNPEGYARVLAKTEQNLAVRENLPNKLTLMMHLATDPSFSGSYSKSELNHSVQKSRVATEQGAIDYSAVEVNRPVLNPLDPKTSTMINDSLKKLYETRPGQPITQEMLRDFSKEMLKKGITVDYNTTQMRSLLEQGKGSFENVRETLKIRIIPK